MTKPQEAIHPVDSPASHNGCYIADDKGLSDQKSNTDSVRSQPLSASELRWQKLDSRTFADRFWSYVTKTDTCWLWTGALDAYGYGQLAIGGHPFKTHRLAWLLAHGHIPLRAHILHACDVRNCVRDSHLFVGDQAANMRDAAAKDRLVGNRKFSDEQIADIRRRYVRRQNGKALAREYGISLVSICRIIAGTQRKLRVVSQ